MGRYVEVYLEDDEGYGSIEEAWDDAADADRQAFVTVYQDHIDEFRSDGAPVEFVWLDDPVKRLEVIVRLRELGYTVEPEFLVGTEPTA